MAIIQVETFSFNKPPKRTEKEYKVLKIRFIENPNLDLTPDREGVLLHFLKEILLIIALILIFGVLAELTDIFFFAALAILTLIFGFGINLFFRYYPYYSAISEERAYYRGMKKRIINSSSYEEFVKKFYDRKSLFTKNY